MSESMLHAVANTGLNHTSVFVGDRAALGRLQAAIGVALHTGSGGISFYTSDGEAHDVAIVLDKRYTSVRYHVRMPKRA